MPRANRNVLRGEETRDAILDAALELFAQRGYRGASLAQIAERCGIVQGAILHHFGSKDQLLLALLNKFFDPEGALLNVDDLDAGPGIVFERLASIVSTNAHRALLVRFYGVMVGESLTEGHPAGPFFAERFTRLREAVTDAMLAKEASLGTPLSPEQARTVASLYIAASDGLQMQWLADPSFDMLDAFSALRRLMQRDPEIRGGTLGETVR